MKKSTLLFIFFTFLMLRLFSQVSLEEGVVDKNLVDSRIEKMLGKSDKYFYLLKYFENAKGKNYLLEKYSIDNYKLEYSKSINIKDETNSVFLNAFYTCGKVIVFRQYTDKENERKKLFMQSIDENGDASPKLAEIFDYTITQKYGAMMGSNTLKEGFVNMVDFEIGISENGKNIIAIA